MSEVVWQCYRRDRAHVRIRRVTSAVTANALRWLDFRDRRTNRSKEQDIYPDGKPYTLRDSDVIRTLGKSGVHCYGPYTVNRSGFKVFVLHPYRASLRADNWSSDPFDSPDTQPGLKTAFTYGHKELIRIRDWSRVQVKELWRY